MMENNKQKVYINPNFKRTGTHFNKYFSNASHIPTQPNRKIFVNPNFLPLKEHLDVNFNPVHRLSLDHNAPKNNTYQNTQNFNAAVIVNSSVLNNMECYPTPIIVTTNQQYIKEPCKTYESYGQNNFKYETMYTQNTPAEMKSRYSFVRNSNLIHIAVNQEEISNINQEIERNSSTNSNIPLRNNSVLEKKSRYCLIRNNTNIIANNANNNMDCKPLNNTIKVSKYKTITLNNFKRELQTENKYSHDTKNKYSQDTKNKYSHQPIRPRLLQQKNKSLSLSILRQSSKQTRYKYKKLEINRKNIELKNIKSICSNNRGMSQPKKTPMRNYKINNIPCPLYVKFGKCLRKSKGNCEYLHDKKHVSLCRKFIKGLCHDTYCLLSHELSAKKMPTCYFYLKGMCTKENCPYLHVKLSNKSKICQDFVKGYCEKGENCTERHVLQQSMRKKIIHKDKQHKLSPKVALKLKSCAKYVKKIKEVKEESATNVENIQSDQRYFKDIVDESEQCETIKPLRCKLGKLPAYIQFV